MSPHAYTEDQLVEQPAIGLFAALGWQTVLVMEEGRKEACLLMRKISFEMMLMSSMLGKMTLRSLNLNLRRSFSGTNNVEGQRS